MLPRAIFSVPVLRPAARNWSRSETLIVFRVPWRLIRKSLYPLSRRNQSAGSPGQVNSEPDKLGHKQITFLAAEDSRVIWEIVVVMRFFGLPKCQVRGPGRTSRVNEALKWLQRAPGELFLKIHIALVAGDQLAEDFANAAMAAGEFDHAIREGRAPEISVKPPAELRRLLQIATKTGTPQFLIVFRPSIQVRTREELSRTQRIVDPFPGDRIGKAGRISKQGPTFTAGTSRVPGPRRETGNARSITLG